MNWITTFREALFLFVLAAVVLCLGGCDEESRPTFGYHAPPARSGTQSPPPPAPWMVNR